MPLKPKVNFTNTIPCCRKAECYCGLFAKNFSRQAVSMTTEHPEVARRVAELTAETAHVFVDIAGSKSPSKAIGCEPSRCYGRRSAHPAVGVFWSYGSGFSLHFNYKPGIPLSFRGVFVFLRKRYQSRAGISFGVCGSFMNYARI